MRGGNNGNSNNSSLSESSNMEPSFYEDNSAQFSPGSIMKRPASLDLNSKNQAKKQRLTQTLPTPGPLVLESPDILACKLTTPELEKILLSSNLPTPTPTLVFPTKVHDCVHVGSEGGDYLRPAQQVTSEQEDYAKGFVDALNDLRNSENTKTQQNLSASAVVTANGMSGGSITYTNLDESFPVAIKDEPQTVPNSPPLSPIDMETQERIKLERKRQRNRVAASKCRKRKLERISKLEEKVKILKGENADLSSVIKQLKEHVFQLKQQVIDHLQAGCDISVYNRSTVLQGK